jgi:Tfp pilus assembly protein PilF
VSGGFPPSAEVHAALASAYSSLGDNHRAREEQLRAIEFLVSDAGSDVEQVFAQLEQLADIAHAAGDREQERGDLERAIEVGEQANSPVLAQRLPLVRERLAALR